MTTINVEFDINDVVYGLDYSHWNAQLKICTNCKVQKYIIRSITISCNSKKEWKKSYRAQELIDDRISPCSRHFTMANVGRNIFTSFEQANTAAAVETARLLSLVMEG